jgi:hypothetical protein
MHTQRVLTSPKSAATAVLFAQKLLKGLKGKVQTDARRNVINSSQLAPPPNSFVLQKVDQPMAQIEIDSPMSITTVRDDQRTFQMHQTDNVLSVAIETHERPLHN